MIFPMPTLPTLTPMHATTRSQVESLARSTATRAGFYLDVHQHAVILGVDAGDSLVIPRRAFNQLINWYTAPAPLRSPPSPP